MNAAVDRGGPFVRTPGHARNWMRASAPGIAPHVTADESSPVGGGAGQHAPAPPTGGSTEPGRTVPPLGDSEAQRTALPPARRIRLKRVLTLAVVGLAFGGATLFGQGVYIHAKAVFAQVLLERAWQRERVTGKAVKPWPWADTHAVARLRAPSQDADVLVLAGASGRTLAFGPGHLDGSALPGDAGNAVITAHRDTHFRFLRAVAAGDEIVVERATGALRRFRVRDAYVADQRALRIPRDTGTPTLTLVTCYPFDAIAPGGPLRYVVVAESV